MESMKLKLSLLLLVISGMTACFGQTDSGKVCLSYQEFDFYAKSVVEKEGLKGDTSILFKEIYYLNNIIDYNEEKVKDYKEIIANKDFSIIEKDNAFENLSKKYYKIEKKHKRLKQTTLVLTIVSCVLGVIVLIK